MRVTVTGATGLIGARLVAALAAARRRGDGALARPGARPRACSAGIEATRWDPLRRAGAGRGARRPRRRRAPRRRAGRAALERRRQGAHPREPRGRHAQPRRGPALLPSRARARSCQRLRASATTAPHGDEQLDESTPPGDDFLAEVCVAWEREAQTATRARDARGDRAHGRRARPRRRRAREDAAAVPRSASAARSPAAGSTCRGSTSTTSSGSTSPRSTASDWSGPLNATAPAAGRRTATSRRRSAARCTAPRSRPCRALALRALYGEMAQIVTTGQRAVPRRALVLGYAFAHPELDEALRSALA